MKANKFFKSAIVFFLISCFSAAYAESKDIEAVKNGHIKQIDQSICLLPSDLLVLKALPLTKWYTLSPVQKEYEIAGFNSGKNQPVKIQYNITLVENHAELELNGKKNILRPGTTWYIALTNEEFDSLIKKSLSISGMPSVGDSGQAIAVVVRNDDTYLGYLSELNNVPFGLMPLVVEGKHQTDLRVLTDCAEFAIYGKRRQGYRINYIGPKLILHYLKKTHKNILIPEILNGRVVYCEENTHMPFSLALNSIEPGDIIHFGDQVAVLYEDKGLKGFLDPEDLMFYSFNNPPRILPIKETEFSNKPLKVYRWNLRKARLKTVEKTANNDKI